MLSLLFGCGGFKKVDTRKVPINAQERARKNVEEGRGVSIGGLLDRAKRSNTYEFSTANPMWRASLEKLKMTMLVTFYKGIWFVKDFSSL